MIQFLSNIPIFRRLFFVFALATIIPGVVIVLLGNFYITSLEAKSSAVKTSFDAQSLASQEETNLQRMNAQLQAKFYQIFASEEGVISDASLTASGGLVDGEIRALEADFDRNLKVYQQNYSLSSNNMENVRSILLSTSNANLANSQQLITSQANALSLTTDQTWPQYQKDQDAELKLLESLQANQTNNKDTIQTDYINAYATLHASTLDFTNLKNNWQSVANDAVEMGKAVTIVGQAEIIPIYVATAAAFLLTVLILIMAFYIVNRTITAPLSKLSTMAEHIAKGDMDARALIVGRDEISKVANAMNNMLNYIIRLIQDAQSQRDTLEARVEKLVTEVSGVGEGDLRIQAEVTSDALGVLADSFNYMVEELSGLIVRVKAMAHEVENSTSITFQSMVQLVENSDVRLQQIGRVSQEIERMASTNSQVAERARSLALVALKARTTAQNGRDSIHQTVEGMGRIQTYVQNTALKVQALGNSSREIDDIVGVIATIAHQTNRLALDAAVQAATAGENGKGFAVVATDIRRLAERAKEQTTMIAQIVRLVGENIDAAAISMKDTERETSLGTGLAEQTGLALESIFSVVDLQNDEIEIINQMVKRQSESSNSIVHIMKTVSESTQQSSASTRGAARNLEHLAHLAEQLLASVEAFKLPNDTNYYGPSHFAPTPVERQNQVLMVNAPPRHSAPGTSGELNAYGNQQRSSQWNNTIDSFNPQRPDFRGRNSGSLNQQVSGPRNTNGNAPGPQWPGVNNGSSGSLNPQGPGPHNNNGPSGPQGQKQNKIRLNRLPQPPTPPER